MNYLLVVVLLSLVILAHEYGHFIAARMMRIPVARFSFGFGPKLWSFYHNQVEYRFAAIPFGGYVMPAITTKEEYFALPVRQRVVFSLGGPVASMLLPLLGFAIADLFLFGFSFYNLLVRPWIQFYDLTVLTITYLPTMFSHPNELSGIIGTVAIGGKLVGLNLLKSVQFMVIISLNLAILNLIPLPVLDGGKALLFLLEKVHPRVLRWHIPLVLVGWGIIIGLTVYVTVIDIVKYLI